MYVAKYVYAYVRLRFVGYNIYSIVGVAAGLADLVNARLITSVVNKNIIQMIRMNTLSNYLVTHGTIHSNIISWHAVYI